MHHTHEQTCTSSHIHTCITHINTGARTDTRITRTQLHTHAHKPAQDHQLLWLTTAPPHTPQEVALQVQSRGRTQGGWPARHLGAPGSRPAVPGRLGPGLAGCGVLSGLTGVRVMWTLPEKLPETFPGASPALSSARARGSLGFRVLGRRHEVGTRATSPRPGPPGGAPRPCVEQLEGAGGLLSKYHLPAHRLHLLGPSHRHRCVHHYLLWCEPDSRRELWAPMGPTHGETPPQLQAWCVNPHGGCRAQVRHTATLPPNQGERPPCPSGGVTWPLLLTGRCVHPWMGVSIGPSHTHCIY